MKQDKVLTVILTIANLILIVFCLVLFLQLDRTEPGFAFQTADIVYRSGMDHEKLKEGVTAQDAADGDVTDRIIIEKMIEDKNENTVVVYYAVSDRAGNVAKSSRVFPAVYTKGKNNDEEAQMLMEAGVAAELVSKKEEVKEAEPLQIEAVEITPSPEPTDSPSPEPAKTPTSGQEEIPEPVTERTPEPVAEREPEQEERSEIPELSLKMSEVTVERGKNPPWVNIINTLKDDKDSYETLFYNLKVSKYDVNKPGTYSVTVYTEDSDGNKSVSVPLNITVK